VGKRVTVDALLELTEGVTPENRTLIARIACTLLLVLHDPEAMDDILSAVQPSLSVVE